MKNTDWYFPTAVAALAILFGMFITLVVVARRLTPEPPARIVVEPAPSPKIVVEPAPAPNIVIEPAEQPAPVVRPAQIIVMGRQEPLKLTDDQNRELHSLRLQHVEALKEQVEVLFIRYEQGSDSITLILKAQEALIEGELAATADPEERIRLLEKSQKLLADVVEIQAARLRVGTGRADDHAQAKAALAGARIKLFLERARQASDGDAPRQSANTETGEGLALDLSPTP